MLCLIPYRLCLLTTILNKEGCVEKGNVCNVSLDYVQLNRYILTALLLDLNLVANPFIISS